MKEERVKGEVKHERMKFSLFHYLIISLLSLLLLACSKGPMTHKAVQKAATDYYTMLIRGKYEKFVQGFADSESWPEDYKKELADLMKQFMSEGNMPSLRSVEALSDSILEDSTAYVMLQLWLGDSIQEQIQLPLVLKEGRWKMK